MALVSTPASPSARSSALQPGAMLVPQSTRHQPPPARSSRKAFTIALGLYGSGRRSRTMPSMTRSAETSCAERGNGRTSAGTAQSGSCTQDLRDRRLLLADRRGNPVTVRLHDLVQPRRDVVRLDRVRVVCQPAGREPHEGPREATRERGEHLAGDRARRAREVGHERRHRLGLHPRPQDIVIGEHADAT